ncbi:SgrR family transcriptional regulator [Shimwellia pseudoproteus]|uniref:SgrR family transcriptional regulator n=1 Tax=Shimwellia pseudoproteus TaxID=570012 RepID=UPI0018ED251A|nr:SgrR family transcriptional regulator [Shimwellia pseudoproteus]MBJ3814823.1 SgrR family transcriptional regulator [Shimwellia pseudoproteus]
MRLLNRLNQFQRLWQPSRGKPQQVTVAEMASRCFCSERHIRTLLHQLADSGWLHWQAAPGRGKRGTLQFLTTPDAVRSTLMERVLNKGQQQNALELAQLAPDQLRQALQPFLGGQWQNDIPTVRIPYYRPLEPLRPGFLAGRAEQHLTSQVFSGLTRFRSDCPLPEGDLAHHWEVTGAGCCYDFWLRPSLWWHNGEKLTAAHLVASLGQLMQQPAMGQLFASVSGLEAPAPGLVRIRLHRPDYWLPHRLASYCSHLHYPEIAATPGAAGSPGKPAEPHTGCGPFKISLYQPELVRLELHDRYHLSHPLIGAVEYWITPQLFDASLGTSCRHPVQIAIGEQAQLPALQPRDKRISLGFCYLAIKQDGQLSARQAQWLMHLIHQSGLLTTLPVEDGLIQPSNALLPGWPLPDNRRCEPVALPRALTLLYHLPVELHAMARQLVSYLARYGCTLTLRFHDAKNWAGCNDMDGADILMGDRLIDDAAEYTLEQWLRCDVLWRAVFSPGRYREIITRLDAIQQHPDAAQRIQGLKTLYEALMSASVLTPLFNYHYQIHAPPNVRGVHINARGWFDFTRLWLPPPENR